MQVFCNTFAPTAVWTGAVSSNWHTAGNWNTGAVPVDTTHVIIPTGTPNPCEISSADAFVASVHVKGGTATLLRVLNGHKLQIKASCATVPNE